METEGVRASERKHYYKAHDEGSVTKEERAVESVAIPIIESNPLKHDFSEPSTDSPLVQKLKNFFNFAKHIGGAFNARTICTGALRDWDFERLKSGKHETLREAGAESLELTSKTEEKVGAHYLGYKQFMETLEGMGGERKVFQNTTSMNPLITGKPVKLMMEQAYTKEAETKSKAEGIPLDEFPIDMLEIDLPKTNSIEEKYQTIVNYDSFLMRTAGARLIYDEATGKCYALKTYAFDRLCQSKYFKSLEDGAWTVSEFKVEPSKVDGVNLELDKPFSAISFDKANPEWVKAAELLAKFDITVWSPHYRTNSSWVVYEDEDRAYLVRAKDVPKLAAGLDMDRENFLETRQPPIEENKATALLTMNQESIYESYISEMAVFALEGMNVLAYNNPGKAFSTGTPDRENINASIDAAYQYVKQVKGVEDKDILAKGQCFGVAPTAWLGAQHPEINLMLDQGGSSFHELAMSIMENKLEDVKDKKPFFAWIGKLLLQNFIIEGLVKALFSGYTTSEDVKKNKGRKIINVNVPNMYREGGDQMVAHYHTEKFADAAAREGGGKVRVSMNPGAFHVTHWFFGEESYDAVTDFLRSIKLMRDDAKPLRD